MASIHQFYSDDSFSSAEFSQFPYLVSAAAVADAGDSTHSYSVSNSGGGGGTVSSTGTSTGPLWGAHEENFPIISFDNYNHVMAPDYSDDVSPAPVKPCPAEHLLGLYESAIMLPTLAEYHNYNKTIYEQEANDVRIQHFDARFQQFPSDDVSCQFAGDDCCAFMHDTKPTAYNPVTGENWGIQNNQMASSMEDGNVTKVGRYSVEERKDRILRYLKKKNQRNFNKTIKYACRKTLADRRVRVRGRFARNNEMSEEESLIGNNKNIQSNSDDSHHPQQEDNHFYCAGDDVLHEMKADEEWLQEAMASLLYLPDVGG